MWFAAFGWIISKDVLELLFFVKHWFNVIYKFYGRFDCYGTTFSHTSIRKIKFDIQMNDKKYSFNDILLSLANVHIYALISTQSKTLSWMRSACPYYTRCYLARDRYISTPRYRLSSLCQIRAFVQPNTICDISKIT